MQSISDEQRKQLRQQGHLSFPTQHPCSVTSWWPWPKPLITRTERSLPGLAKRWPRIVPAAPARDNAVHFQGLLPLSPFIASLNVSIIFFSPCFGISLTSSVILLPLFQQGQTGPCFPNMTHIHWKARGRWQSIFGLPW